MRCHEMGEEPNASVLYTSCAGGGGGGAAIMHLHMVGVRN